MKSIKIIVDQSKELDEFRQIIDVYEDIAASKLRQIKTGIVQTRQYYDGLRAISLEVGSDFQAALENEKPKEAAVFISANGGLYGEVTYKTFRLFLEYVRSHPTQNFIAGTLGAQLMKQYAKKVSYTPVPLNETNVVSEAVSQVLETVVSYHKISVFYPKFRNIVVQEPQVGLVTGKIFPQDEKDLKALARKRTNFIYEPSLYQVSEVFTQVILKGVLEQMLLEAQLARLGSRVMHLDQALDKTDKLIKNLDGQKHRAKKRMLEKKQNEYTTKILIRKRMI